MVKPPRFHKPKTALRGRLAVVAAIGRSPLRGLTWVTQGGKMFNRSKRLAPIASVREFAGFGMGGMAVWWRSPVWSARRFAG